VEENYVNNGMSDDLSNSKGSNKQQWCRVNSKLSWKTYASFQDTGQIRDCLCYNLRVT